MANRQLPMETARAHMSSDTRYEISSTPGYLFLSMNDNVFVFNTTRTGMDGPQFLFYEPLETMARLANLEGGGGGGGGGGGLGSSHVVARNLMRSGAERHLLIAMNDIGKDGSSRGFMFVYDVDLPLYAQQMFNPRNFTQPIMMFMIIVIGLYQFIRQRSGGGGGGGGGGGAFPPPSAGMDEYLSKLNGYSRDGDGGVEDDVDGGVDAAELIRSFERWDSRGSGDFSGGREYYPGRPTSSLAGRHHGGGGGRTIEDEEFLEAFRRSHRTYREGFAQGDEYAERRLRRGHFDASDYDDEIEEEYDEREMYDGDILAMDHGR